MARTQPSTRSQSAAPPGEPAKSQSRPAAKRGKRGPKILAATSRAARREQLLGNEVSSLTAEDIHRLSGTPTLNALRDDYFELAPLSRVVGAPPTDEELVRTEYRSEPLPVAQLLAASVYVQRLLVDGLRDGRPGVLLEHEREFLLHFASAAAAAEQRTESALDDLAIAVLHEHLRQIYAWTRESWPRTRRKRLSNGERVAPREWLTAPEQAVANEQEAKLKALFEEFEGLLKHDVNTAVDLARAHPPYILEMNGPAKTAAITLEDLKVVSTFRDVDQIRQRLSMGVAGRLSMPSLPSTPASEEERARQSTLSATVARAIYAAHVGPPAEFMPHGSDDERRANWFRKEIPSGLPSR
jgi:hypothetical protein